MYVNKPFQQWVVLAASVVLSAKGAIALFTFPTSASTTGFRVGDTIVVSWTSSFKQPSLELYGNYQEQRMSFYLVKFLFSIIAKSKSIHTQICQREWLIELNA